VRKRVERGFASQLQILRGNLGVLDPLTGYVGGLEDAQTVYDGPGRVRVLAGMPVAVGPGQQAVRRVTVSVPIAVSPRVDDLVKITATDAADQNLTSRILRVVEVDGGGLFGDARRMTTESWFESRYWGQQ
jgi:hypothetical protein